MQRNYTVAALGLCSLIAVCLGVVCWHHAWADPLPDGVPPVNSQLTGCVEGRAIRIINGGWACNTQSAPPTTTSCGTGTIDSSATDFIGQVSLPAGLTSCTIVFSKLYSSPPLICLMQPQTSGLTLSVGSGVTGSNGTVSTLTIPFGLSVAGAKFGYICGPG